MNAIEFVKKFGLDDAREYLDGAGFWRTDLTPIIVNMDDLKQIVDAFELVEKYKNRHGGIRFRIRWGMFRYGDTQEFNERLKQAINLVEQCQ